MNARWLQIRAPHFCAAVSIRDGKVLEAAPILAYMRGWSEERVMDYARQKGWQWRWV